MKIVFCVTNFGFLRNFQTTLGLLAQRGHRLHLVADRTDTTGGQRMVEDLVATYPGITYEVFPPVRGWLWSTYASAVRLTLDYWRYLEPRFASAVQLRDRAERQVPALSRSIVRVPVLRTPLGRRILAAAVRAAERVIPVRTDVMALLERETPDLLLMTPLLYFGSRQVEHVRAARILGIPTLLGVGSWDHLTTKGLIHEIPDYVAVWNELQKAEATELHGVPPARIIVTGAQAYDHWFDRSPTTTRQEFCDRAGLAADRPYLLYLCSSPFITPHEVPFIRRWIETIRSSPAPELQSVGLLVRPHPQNAEQWAGIDLSSYGNVAIWPRAGANPIDAAAKSDYFDSMFHSHAVVGVNTSGLIESGIVGRRVYSVLADEFSTTQEGTLHFQHLKNVEGGLLRLAASFDEHVQQLRPTLTSIPAAGEDRKVRGFVQAFVRPYGLEIAAAPRLVQAVEDVAARRVPARRESVQRRVGRAAMTPIAFALMLAGVDRNRWWSWGIQVTSPARHLFRAVRRFVIETWRAVRRFARTTVRALYLRVRGMARAAWRLAGRTVRGLHSAARGTRGDAPYVE